jgi:hypothetical protein
MTATKVSHAEDVESAQSKMDRDAATVYPWAEAFHEFCCDDMRSANESMNDKERIACLEIIVAILIEKNERFRQQLLRQGATEK